VVQASSLPEKGWTFSTKGESQGVPASGHASSKPIFLVPPGDSPMSLWSRSNRLLHRRGRSINLGSPSTATLELRTLLSATAVITWQMAPQIARDPAHGDQPDLPNTYDYVNPPSGYEVLLSAAHSKGILPSTTFAWIVTSSSGQSTPLTGEYPTIDLQQGAYTVTITAAGLRHSSTPVTTTTSIQVKDVLIVSIGDSYASGEGDPVVHGIIDPEWAYSPNAAMKTQNADAHRSTVAAPAQFALELQKTHPHEAVTFVSVADSGASIPDGILGPMQSIGDSYVQLPAQLAELQTIIGSHPIDLLTVSIGGNDVGFASIIEDLIENTDTDGYPSLASIQATFDNDLAMLPTEYSELNASIKTILHPDQVMITDYPDITRNQHGNPAEFYGVLDIPLITKADAKFASQEIVAPLNATIATAAATNNWTLVNGFNKDFLTHGYPSSNPWINTIDASEEAEGSTDGSFHPNALGHLDIAKYLLEAYLKNPT
jgi:lysophospholipase L1-like esterase